jgi:hypothetical protein
MKEVLCVSFLIKCDKNGELKEKYVAWAQMPTNSVLKFYEKK